MHARHYLRPFGSDYAGISSAAIDLLSFIDLNAAKPIRTGCKPSFPVPKSCPWYPPLHEGCKH
jgi:hypothetical protein